VPTVPVALAVAATVAGCWLALVILIALKRPPGMRAADAARLLPDIARLVSRLARDHAIPRRLRVRIWLLVAFMASPLDLVPDVVPVVGVVDDLVLAFLVLRSVVASAGPEALRRNWSGPADGLRALESLLGCDQQRPPLST